MIVPGCMPTSSDSRRGESTRKEIVAYQVESVNQASPADSLIQRAVWDHHRGDRGGVEAEWVGDPVCNLQLVYQVGKWTERTVDEPSEGYRKQPNPTS